MRSLGDAGALLSGWTPIGMETSPQQDSEKEQEPKVEPVVITDKKTDQQESGGATGNSTLVHPKASLSPTRKDHSRVNLSFFSQKETEDTAEDNAIREDESSSEQSSVQTVQTPADKTKTVRELMQTFEILKNSGQKFEFPVSFETTGTHK